MLQLTTNHMQTLLFPVASTYKNTHCQSPMSHAGRWAVISDMGIPCKIGAYLTVYFLRGIFGDKCVTVIWHPAWCWRNTRKHKHQTIEVCPEGATGDCDRLSLPDTAITVSCDGVLVTKSANVCAAPKSTTNFKFVNYL